MLSGKMSTEHIPGSRFNFQLSNKKQETKTKTSFRARRSKGTVNQGDWLALKTTDRRDALEDAFWGVARWPRG